MELSDLDYEFLLTKYISLGYIGKALEERLQQVDPYADLGMLRIINPGLDF